MSSRRVFLGSMIGGSTGMAMAAAATVASGPGPRSERANSVRLDRRRLAREGYLAGRD